MRHFYEFFAGGGMARAGLGSGWSCLYANDFDPMKAATYSANWGDDDMHLGDINDVRSGDLPGRAALAWASFPCQDLSLAGNYAGIGSVDDVARTRSGTFWAFWKLMLSLKADHRAPAVIVLENVYGVLTANGGRDFAAIGSCFAGAGYQFGALLIDAAHFVPQSRPRVFIVGVRGDVAVPNEIVATSPQSAWHPKALVGAYDQLAPNARDAWIWWNMPLPRKRRQQLERLIDVEPTGVDWHTTDETQRLLNMMSDRNRSKVEALKRLGRRAVATVYRRTRNGIQRAEVRADGIAGCLRTPAGGSSRQLIIEVDGDSVRSRLLSPREAARLMGLPNRYKLPRNYNDAYHVAGDGVAVPAVRHLAETILEPLAASLAPSVLADAA